MDARDRRAETRREEMDPDRGAECFRSKAGNKYTPNKIRSPIGVRDAPATILESLIYGTTTGVRTLDAVTLIGKSHVHSGLTEWQRGKKDLFNLEPLLREILNHTVSTKERRDQRRDRTEIALEKVSKLNSRRVLEEIIDRLPRSEVGTSVYTRLDTDCR